MLALTVGVAALFAIVSAVPTKVNVAAPIPPPVYFTDYLTNPAAGRFVEVVVVGVLLVESKWWLKCSSFLRCNVPKHAMITGHLGLPS